MPPGQKIRILVVDDSAVMRSLLRSVIATDSSLEIVGAAADGESALRLIESLRPDLVLLDVEMPVMDGLMTLRQMRARNLRPPVIMCSALTQRGARVTIESLASGASDYVAKPSNQLGPAVAIQNLAHELLPKIFALTNRNAPATPHLQQSSAGVQRITFAGRFSAAFEPGDYSNAKCGGDWNLNWRSGCARYAFAQPSGKLSIAGSGCAAYAGAIHAPSCRAIA